MRKALYDVNEYLLRATPVGPMLGYPNDAAPTVLRPIIPVQQVPEFNSMDPEIPYIVYSGRSMPMIDQWWISQDEITYTIWGNDLDTINDVAIELFDIFRRLDESADDINNYLQSIGRNDFRFHFVRVMGDFTPEAATTEGGRFGHPITFRYEYVNQAGRGVS